MQRAHVSPRFLAFRREARHSRRRTVSSCVQRALTQPYYLKQPRMGDTYRCHMRIEGIAFRPHSHGDVAINIGGAILVTQPVSSLRHSIAVSSVATSTSPAVAVGSYAARFRSPRRHANQHKLVARAITFRAARERPLRLDCTRRPSTPTEAPFT